MSSYGYIRKSKLDDNIVEKIRIFAEYGVSRTNTYVDNEHIRKSGRKQFKIMFSKLVAGDTIFVDRMASVGSIKQVIEIIDMMTERDIGIVFIREDIDNCTEMGTRSIATLKNIDTYMDEVMEEHKIKVRFTDSYVHGRRGKSPEPKDEEQLDQIYKMICSNKISISEAAKKVKTFRNGEWIEGISIGTFSKMFKKWLNENGIRRGYTVTGESYNEI